MLASRLRFVFIVLLAGFALCASAAGEEQDNAPAPPGKQTSLEFQGLTRPSQQAELTLRVPGIITQRPIEEGQEVEPGQLIAALDSAPEEAAVRISQIRAENASEVRAAEVNETRRREELDRQRKLVAGDSTSAWELREAELAFEFAEAQTETARRQREQRKQELIRNQALLTRRRLSAPFGGVIWRTPKEVGEAVSVDEREPIAVLVCLDPLWVELNLPAKYFGRIAPGQNGTVTVQEHVRTANVICVDPLVDSGSSTFRVRLELANEDLAFVAGVPASVHLELADPSTHTAKRTGKETRTASRGLEEKPVPR